MKYKVGDKVKLKKEVLQTMFGDMRSLLGKTVTISRVASTYYEFTEDREKWCWAESSVECLACNNKNNKIVITTDGAETLARLYEGGKVVKSATAKCSPRDEFDFNIGARLAFDRLTESTAKKTAEKKEEYYNGKVVCIRGGVDLTVGKIYEFIDGKFKDDVGDLRPCPCTPENRVISLDEDWASTYFIEFVE